MFKTWMLFCFLFTSALGAEEAPKFVQDAMATVRRNANLQSTPLKEITFLRSGPGRGPKVCYFSVKLNQGAAFEVYVVTEINKVDLGSERLATALYEKIFKNAYKAYFATTGFSSPTEVLNELSTAAEVRFKELSVRQRNLLLSNHPEGSYLRHILEMHEAKIRLELGALNKVPVEVNGMQAIVDLSLKVDEALSLDKMAELKKRMKLAQDRAARHFILYREPATQILIDHFTQVDNLMAEVVRLQAILAGSDIHREEIKVIDTHLAQLEAILRVCRELTQGIRNIQSGRELESSLGRVTKLSESVRSLSSIGLTLPRMVQFLTYAPTLVKLEAEGTQMLESRSEGGVNYVLRKLVTLELGMLKSQLALNLELEALKLKVAAAPGNVELIAERAKLELELAYLIEHLKVATEMKPRLEKGFRR